MILTLPVSEELGELSSISEISCKIWEHHRITVVVIGSDVSGFQIE